MRKIFNILLLIAVGFAAQSCLKDNLPTRQQTRVADGKALMKVTMVTGGAETDEEIKTVRFIVFDNASTSPELDVNRKMDVGAAHQASTKFNVTLDVNRNKDKMVVAIVNEPALMSGDLDKVVSASELEDMPLKFSQALNATHTVFLAAGMPMTGVKRGVAVTVDNDTEAKAAQVAMHIDRAVARVDLWLKRASDVASAELTASTTVTLTNTYDRGYLVAGTEEDGTRGRTGAGAVDNFGHLMTVPAASLVEISANPGVKTLTTTEQYICSFYTPERTCTAADDADKLGLKIAGITADSQTRGGETVIKSAILNGESTSQDIELVQRNNVYKVVGTVNSSIVTLATTAHVTDWNDAPIAVSTEKPYFLTVSKKEVTLQKYCMYNDYIDINGYIIRSALENVIITTNYSGGWKSSVWSDPECTQTIPATYDHVRINPSSTYSASPSEGNKVVLNRGYTTMYNGIKYVKITAGRMYVVIKVNCVPATEMFACSNVVLGDDGRLTFATTEEENNYIPANAQGVFFKWGSLIGISSDNIPLDGQIFGADNVVFKPENLSVTWDESSFSAIPYIDEFAGTNGSSMDEDALLTYYDMGSSTPGYDEAAGKGDVCRYISDKGWVDGRWRTPTIREYYYLLTNDNAGETPAAEPDVTKNKGLYTMNVLDPQTVDDSYPLSRYPVNDGWWLGHNVVSDAIKTERNKTNPPTGTRFLPFSGGVVSKGLDDKIIYAGGYIGYGWGTEYSVSQQTLNTSRVIDMHKDEIILHTGTNTADGSSVQVVRCIRDYRVNYYDHYDN